MPSRRGQLEPELSSARTARRLLRDSLKAAGWRAPPAGPTTPSSPSTSWWPTPSCTRTRPSRSPSSPGPTGSGSRSATSTRRCRQRAVRRAGDHRPGDGAGRGAHRPLRCPQPGRAARSSGSWASPGPADESGWDVDETRAPERPPGDGKVHVRLLAMPIRLWLAARQHHDALLRELVLYVSERDPAEVDLAERPRAGHRLAGRAGGGGARAGACTTWEPRVDVDVTCARPGAGVRRPAGLARPGRAARRPRRAADPARAARDRRGARLGLPPDRGPAGRDRAVRLAGTAHERFETAVNTMPGPARCPPTCSASATRPARSSPSTWPTASSPSATRWPTCWAGRSRTWSAAGRSR